MEIGETFLILSDSKESSSCQRQGSYNIITQMEKIFNRIGKFLLDLLFPKSCLGCQKEGEFLCQDCLSIIEILEYQFCPYCRKRVIEGKTCHSCKKFTKLDGLYFATSYQNYLVKKLIFKFKYQPFIKELKKPLASLIITHFQLLEIGKSDFSDYLLVPVPLEKKRLKWRGFNQAEEIAKEIAKSLERARVINNVLFKIKETLPQIELSEKEREENVKGVFLVKNNEKLIGRKILLVDDVYTTGATMNECARILKESGAKEVWGVTIARE